MLHPRVINDLCRFPMWIIDNINIISNNSVEIVGWALTNNGDLTTGLVLLNSKHPDEFSRTQNADYGRIFPWHDNADWAPYRAIYHNVDLLSEELLRFSYAGQWTRTPFNRWQDIWFPLRAWRDQSVIIPDGPRMQRTQGGTDPFWYVTYGTTAAQVLNEATRTYFGRDLASFQDICDWGAGCGRVVQAVRRIAPQSSITGIDIDHDNMAWCQRSIPFGAFATIPLFPPTEFPAGRFDLLYGISVFSHLARDAAEAWRDEIYRIVRPGGVVLATFHGGTSLVSTADEDLIMSTLTSGFNDATRDNALSDQIDDSSYYRGTFMSVEQAVNLFSVRFRVRDVVPQVAGAGQDLVVCERI